VTGTVSLANAPLTVAVGFVPPPFATFTIINNDGTDAVTGTFAGLPQGARLTAGGVSFSISYTGGTGNDVVLTALPAAPTATADAASTPFATPTALMPASNDTAGSGATLLPGSIDLDPATPGQQTVRTVTGRGTFTVNTSTGQVAFVPESSFFGIAAVDYTITDNLGQLSNVATISVAVAAPVADVTITQTGTATVTPGASAQVTYTMTVTNGGPRDASSVIVANSTPAGLAFVSNTGACTTPFPCDLGTLSAGSVRTITATYAVSASYAGPNPIVNTASVSTTASSDPTLANNIAAAQNDRHAASRSRDHAERSRPRASRRADRLHRGDHEQRAQRYRGRHRGGSDTGGADVRPQHRRLFHGIPVPARHDRRGREPDDHVDVLGSLDRDRSSHVHQHGRRECLDDR
jgi:uncharacterized repeat protein (TIGR01451 family)